jgi:acyl-CoA reductase-like NAD-dependent aldehyde dehydrogenase
MEMLLGGEWRAATNGATEVVRSPYDDRPVGSVPVATIDDAAAAVDYAEAAARVQRETPAHERVTVLLRAADLADQRAEDIAQTISAETGKPISEARGEASRSGAIIRLAAHEGSQLYGSTLPLDANPGTGLEKIGFTLRQPCGIVVAITPFNYPALLVLHKIAPALAAGNAVVLKPARSTPLTALKLAECFVDAGLAPGALSVLTGSGATLGDRLVTDPRVRKVSFTGSTATGTHLAAVAGIKKLSLELGASCPVIVLPDADIDMAASAVAAGGYINAGQVCISVQRVIVDERVEADFLDALVPKVDAITLGDPAREDTRLGSLISETEATRVHSAIRLPASPARNCSPAATATVRSSRPQSSRSSTHSRRSPATSCSDPPSRYPRPPTSPPRSPSPMTANTAWGQGFSPPTWRRRYARCARSTPATSISIGPRCGAPI